MKNFFICKGFAVFGSIALFCFGANLAVAQDPDRAEAHRIGPQDLIAIAVFEVPALNVEVRVNPTGSITLPLLGEFDAQGSTASELSERLKSLLEEKYVHRATVTVEVKEYRSNPITVLGAVHQPGPLPYSGRWRLQQVIAAAGGLTDRHGGEIQIRRSSKKGLSDQISIRTDDLQQGAQSTFNIPIFANDLINVPPASDVTIYLLGAVAGAGVQTFKSRERITLLETLVRAGGLSERASKKVIIRRDAGNGLREETIVDYRRILNGKEPDFELQDGDIVHVKESFF
jgi:polysaccharide export outer membrane protein